MVLSQGMLLGALKKSALILLAKRILQKCSFDRIHSAIDCCMRHIE